MNEYKGNLISLEGVDGVGTTTVSERLQEKYSSENWNFTAEPSEGVYGRYLRKELQSNSDPTASDFFLFCADRFDHIESLIGPKLDSGENVVTDRYNLSTFAYQTQVIEEDLDVQLPEEFIQEILDEFVIEPDLTIVIDAPIEETYERLSGDKEKYEKVDRLETARETYLNHASVEEHIEVVDGTQEIDEVVEDCISLVEEL